MLPLKFWKVKNFKKGTKSDEIYNDPTFANLLI